MNLTLLYLDKNQYHSHIELAEEFFNKVKNGEIHNFFITWEKEKGEDIQIATTSMTCQEALGLHELGKQVYLKTFWNNDESKNAG